MTAPCLSLTGTKKQVCACLQHLCPAIIPLPCGYSGLLVFVPSLALQLWLPWQPQLLTRPLVWALVGFSGHQFGP